MSRIGKQPIALPSNVTVAVENGIITANGPKGSLTQPLLEGITVATEDGKVIVSRLNDEAESRARHGLIRALVNNMVQGVSNGFSRQLEINGVGFRANIQGKLIKLSLGFSHEVNYTLPEGIAATLEQNVLTVSGINKQQVGQVAAEIRALKKPEPYKGKGIKYSDERIVRKAGKSGKEK